MAHDSTQPVAFEAPEIDLDLPPEHSPDWLSERGEPPRQKAALPLPFEWEGDWLGLRHLKAGKVTRKTNLNPPDYDGLSADAIERRHAFGTAPLRPPERVEIRCETFAPTIWHYTLPTKLCCEQRDPVKASSGEISVQDRSLDAAPTFLVIRKQRFECRNCRKRFFEVLPDVNEARGVKQRGKKKIEGKLVAYKKLDVPGIKHMVTKRLRRDIALAAVKYTAAEAAQLLHVHIATVDRIYADYRDVVTADHKYHLPRKLGIDGTFLLGKARCVIADVESNRILDILPHDNSAAVFQHIAQTFSKAEREIVEVFVHDMAKMYGWIQTLFPNAIRVIDRYHIVSLIQKHTDSARNAIVDGMDEPSQKMLRKSVRLFKGPRYSLNARDKLEHDKITAANQRLFHVMQSRKLFEEIFKEEDHSAALWRYQLWVDYIHEGRTCAHPKTGEPMSYSLLPWFGPLHNTIEELKTPIFAGFVKKYRYTTAFVEGMNRRAQEINRDANGLSFKSLRAKALLRYGEYHTQADLVSFKLKLFPIGITPESYSLGSEEFEVFEKLLEQCHPRGHRRIANLHPLIYAILWRTMNGSDWKDLNPYPAHFGKPATAARTFYRWAQIGVWERLILAADAWRERVDLPPLQHRPNLQVRNVWWHENPVIQQAVEYVLMLPGLLVMIAEREQELMTEERVWTGFTPDDLYAASR